MDALGILDRAPRWLRRASIALIQGPGPVGWLSDRLRRPGRGGAVPDLPPSDGASRVRLLIGPANEAEQGYQWARAARRFPGVSATAMMGLDPGGYRVRADITVPEAVASRSRPWHDRFERYLLDRTHVIGESGLPLLGRGARGGAFAELARLRSAGVQVGVMFHGSDIRPPLLHAASSRWSPFRDRRSRPRLLADRAERNAEGARRLGAPVFVSTPDLLQWVPDAIWCPVVVDPRQWRSGDRDRLTSARPVVVHAPSNPLLKGTDRIEPALHRLHRDGVIDYRPISGVPHADIPALFAAADVVLDQFVIGSYGVVSCEALAAGCLVVAHVDEATRAAVLERTGMALPIVEATVDTVESLLRLIASEPHRFESSMAAGPAFVDAVHDGRLSAAAMAGFLGVTG